MLSLRDPCRRAAATNGAAGGNGGGGAPAGKGARKATADHDVPLLVRVLAGNCVTSATILGCLNTADTRALRRLHPAVAVVVAGVAWVDMGVVVVDTVRWRAAFPAAVGARVSPRPMGGRLAPPALAALAGVTHLDLQYCEFMTDKVLLCLPPSLRTLNVSSCRYLTEDASLVHLTALMALDCRWTSVVEYGVASLPPLLQDLNISDMNLLHWAPPARLAHLRVLRASRLDSATLASLPTSLLELQCGELPSGASFAHLPALHTLDVSGASIDDASLATMPPSLVSLNAFECKNLTPAAVLPPLLALRMLDVGGTSVGDALVASLPVGLLELRMLHCGNVTAGATLDHVRALQALHSYNTNLAPGVLADCRARGCTVPVAGVLRGHGRNVTALAVLADGRLAGGDAVGEVRVWDMAAGGGVADIIWNAGSNVGALAALRDGHRLAAGLWHGGVEIWEVGVMPPVRTTTIDCGGSVDVKALAVLADGRLAAGCGDGAVRIIDVDAGAVVATLAGHTGKVWTLVELPGGALASGSFDESVRVWDVGTRVCVATLTVRSGRICALAVLADGRLVSRLDDGTVRVWDVGTRTCVGVLTGNMGSVTALAALPDGRLVTVVSDDRTVRVWDTRPAAAVAGRHAAGTVAMVVITRVLHTLWTLLPLPDGRLACAEGDAVHLLHVPPPAPYEAME